MPSRKQHLDQKTHNKVVLDVVDGPTKQGRTAYCDWIIIIAFYTALHIVESRIDAAMNSRVPKDKLGHNHAKRNWIVMNEAIFSSIRKDYLALWNHSVSARYDCIYDEKVATTAVELLDRIEKQMCK